MRGTPAMLSAVVLLAACGGCAGSSGGAASTTSASPSSSSGPTSTTTATTATATATKAPQPADKRLPLGKVFTAADSDATVTVTVQKVLNPVRTSPIEGEQLAGALVRSCVKSIQAYDSIGFSWGPWAAFTADDSRYPAANTLYDYPKPWFPNGESDGTFGPGECVKGWIYFDVSKGVKLDRITYKIPGHSASWRAS